MKGFFFSKAVKPEKPVIEKIEGTPGARRNPAQKGGDLETATDSAQPSSVSQLSISPDA